MACALVLGVLGCATARPHGDIDASQLQREWFYVPGPYETQRQTQDGLQDARVGPEVDGAWVVLFGEPATTIRVERLPDGRPATALIADPARQETAVFDPPLALLPSDEPEEVSDLAIYRGLFPQGPPQGLAPKNTGKATRRFLDVEDTTWTWQGDVRPAQVLNHELVLDLSPAEIRQTHRSKAVEGKGIVEETIRERLSILGVVVRTKTTRASVVAFTDRR